MFADSDEISFRIAATRLGIDAMDRRSARFHYAEVPAERTTSGFTSGVRFGGNWIKRRCEIFEPFSCVLHDRGEAEAEDGLGGMTTRPVMTGRVAASQDDHFLFASQGRHKTLTRPLRQPRPGRERGTVVIWKCTTGNAGSCHQNWVTQSPFQVNANGVEIGAFPRKSYLRGDKSARDVRVRPASHWHRSPNCTKVDPEKRRR